MEVMYDKETQASDVLGGKEAKKSDVWRSRGLEMYVTKDGYNLLW